MPLLAPHVYSLPSVDNQKPAQKAGFLLFGAGAARLVLLFDTVCGINIHVENGQID
jgi:hypothetical protein